MERRLVDAVAREFGLGTPTGVEPLRGGSAPVVRLTTDRGCFVAKRFDRAWELELYAVVERALNARGVRQAKLLWTRSGAATGATGYSVQEWLPGAIADHPSPRASEALMRYLRAYDEALREIPVPPELDAEDNVWTRVVSPSFLLTRLAELFERHATPDLAIDPVLDALAVLEQAAPWMVTLPTQLVHGDHGPGNVLYAGEEVVAVVDFTPSRQPALFSVSTAAYWHHVYGSACTDLAQIEADLAAYGLTATERDAFWPMLLREALRRLATPLAVAEEFGTAARQDAVRARHAALRSLAATRAYSLR